MSEHVTKDDLRDFGLDLKEHIQLVVAQTDVRVRNVEGWLKRHEGRLHALELDRRPVDDEDRSDPPYITRRELMAAAKALGWIFGAIVGLIELAIRIGPGVVAAFAR